MGTLSEYHSDYEPDCWVVTAWNGSGTAMVFSTREAYEELIAEYEDFRVAHSLPWLHGKSGVDGDMVLAMWKIGMRPWTVSLGPYHNIINIRAKPLHHVSLELITTRYINGDPRLLEVWADSEEHAWWYVTDMFNAPVEPPPSMDNDVDFDMGGAGTDAKTAAAVEELRNAPPPPPPTVIPGFGIVTDISEL